VRRVAGLLRAVNVGGRKLLMADLKRITHAAGFAAPQTLLASGNVIFGTTVSDDLTSERLAVAVLDGAGLATDVMVRDADQLAAVMAANPFQRQARDGPSRLMAMFLNAEPQDSLETLAPACSGGEEIGQGPRCLYISYPQGAGTSRLTGALIERRLNVRGTARNWNTVGKLAAATSAKPG
jgi:uncharacterized protein (DUF1697 family)